MTPPPPEVPPVPTTFRDALTFAAVEAGMDEPLPNRFADCLWARFWQHGYLDRSEWLIQKAEAEDGE